MAVTPRQLKRDQSVVRTPGLDQELKVGPHYLWLHPLGLYFSLFFFMGLLWAALPPITLCIGPNLGLPIPQMKMWFVLSALTHGGPHMWPGVFFHVPLFDYFIRKKKGSLSKTKKSWQVNFITISRGAQWRTTTQGKKKKKKQTYRENVYRTTLLSPLATKWTFSALPPRQRTAMATERRGNAVRWHISPGLQEQ